MEVSEKQKLFFTDNLKLAAALTVAGFEILNVDRIIVSGVERQSFELEPKKHGIKAHYFLSAFRNEIDLAKRVDEIIEARGLTEEEFAILAFDAARSGLHNGGTLLYCARNKRPLVAKEISGGRTLIYREGTPRDHLKKLIENA